LHTGLGSGIVSSQCANQNCIDSVVQRAVWEVLLDGAEKWLLR